MARGWGLVRPQHVTRPIVGTPLSFLDSWKVEAFERGIKIWETPIFNVITEEGLNTVLDRMFKTATPATPTWYIGLVNNSPAPTYAYADIMTSHAGWTEWTSYSQAARQTYSPGTIDNGVVSNVASKATFSISASGTLDGAFICSNSTKGGTSGVLFAAGPFATGDKVVTAATTLVVTFTCTAEEMAL
jgi:hypothetical protein